MKRTLASRLVPTLSCATLSLMLAGAWSAPASAQARNASNPNWEVPRNVYGQPDLQGNWTNATLTPLTRPRGRSAVLTAAEVQEIESGAADAVQEAISEPSDPNRPLPPGGSNPVCIDSGTTCYNEVYRDPGERVAVVRGEARSSILMSPDGYIPSLTAEGQRVVRDMRAATTGFGPYDHPELRPASERCIVSFGSNAGPPMLPNYWYNNNYTIVQNQDYVAILTEMVHDTRIIQLGEPDNRLPPDVKPYFGDSWGHWEGNTLVVETTNVNPDASYRGVPLSDEGRIVERFTRWDAETIVYEFTIDDPVMYTQAWGGELPFRKFDDLVFEYACHEGNYALEGVLRGARFAEQEGTTP